MTIRRRAIAIAHRSTNAHVGASIEAALLVFLAAAARTWIVAPGLAELARYFGQSLSGRSNAAANLLMFLWAFVVQYGAGAIIGLFPTRAGGGYAPEAYQWAFGSALAVQVVALAWFLMNRRRIREAGER